MGAADAAANLLCEFNMAAKKDDKLTKIKNGNVILVNWIASSIFSEFLTKPGAIKEIKAGINISTRMTKKNNPKSKKLKISLANLFDFDLPLASSEV